jgi:hypothetical protein
MFYRLNSEKDGCAFHQCMQIANKYGGAFEILDRVDGDWSQGTKVRVWLPKADA